MNVPLGAYPSFTIRLAIFSPSKPASNASSSRGEPRIVRVLRKNEFRCNWDRLTVAKPFVHVGNLVSSFELLPFFLFRTSFSSLLAKSVFGGLAFFFVPEALRRNLE